MTRLLTDRAAWSVMSKAAREHVEKNWTWEAAGYRLEEALGGLTARSAGIGNPVVRSDFHTR